MNLLFPDPVLEMYEIDPIDDDEKGTGIHCSHCHKEIKGRLRHYNNQYFDSYCWNLRFILRVGDEDDGKKEEMKKFIGTRINKEMN